MIAAVKLDGEKVRQARERAFLSKRELAREAELNRNTMTRIESGAAGEGVEVHPRTIRKLAAALSVDPATLTPESGEE